MSTSPEYDLHKELLNVKRVAALGEYNRNGICNLLVLPTNPIDVSRAVDRLHIIWKEWPEFSGEINYPVPGGVHRFYHADDKWSGEYGESRRRLLDFLIERTSL